MDYRVDLPEFHGPLDLLLYLVKKNEVDVRDIPIEWNQTCDSFNFFASPEHVRRWEDALPEKRGVTMAVDRMVALVQGIATTRYWDYDRGSDSSGSEDAITKQ